jgi:hypothetical protein
MRNVTIQVEGYHDRSFLSGWLLHRGWSDPGRVPSGRVPVRNPVTGKAVTGGRFAFVAASGSTFVEIAPNQGDTNLLGILDGLVKRLAPPEPDELIVVLDVDDEDRAGGIGRREQSVDDRLARSRVEVTRDGASWRLASGVRVHLALWSCDGEACDGVPARHTLERIICAAIARAHPTRASAVQGWLDGRPAMPPSPSPKEHSWSYMAGWYADHGCDAFLSNLWSDPNVATALDDLLSTSGLEAILRSYE